LGGAQGYFLKGLGDGGFADPVGYPFPTTQQLPWAYSVAAGRFGPGANLGFVTANGIDQSISIFLGNGDGTFASPLTIPEVTSAGSVAAGDFNGDGFDDLALDLTVALSNGDGTFGATTSYGPKGGFVRMADLDGDGRAEVLSADYYGGDTLTILWNPADAGASITTYAAGTRPASLVAADLNGDGTLDVAVGNVAGGVNVYINACP
jgi:FG-GAP-like repeat